MLEIARDLILKVLGAVVPWLIGWFYKPHRISSNIQIRPAGEGEAITIIGGELPNVQIWLQVSNLSPFTIEIDRMIVQFQYGAIIGEFNSTRRTTLKSATEARMKIEGALTPSQLASVARMQPSTNYATLYLTAFVNCKVHSFELSRSPQTSNIRCLGIPSAA